HPPSHKPRADPYAKPLPAGTWPRLKSRSRIIKGEGSKMFEYPWMTKISGCGASLINEDLSNGKSMSSSFLLTAAHCIQ
uniref:Peptidase S1 domain-containing protein n=1 Tax=Romanomermis culicivorax TaxID=13658 RepID=A0A915IYA7_ROMCU